MLHRRQLLAAFLATACVGAIGHQAEARTEAFPSHPIKFVVPFGPGSGTDTSARYFARQLQTLTGQPVVVENKPGANGFIAVKSVLSAPADGYTVFIGSNSTLAVNAALFKELPYDPVKDFAPLTMMMRSPAMLAVSPKAPYSTLKDLIAYGRAHPGKVNFGAGSAGYQLMGELLNDAAGLKAVHVPFKGASEAITAVAASTVDYTFAEVTAVQELAKDGRVKVVAVASDQRVGTSPDVPTAAEAGLPGFEAYTWVGAMVSAKTPPAETARLAELFTQISKMPDTRAFYERLGATPMTGGPTQMHEFQKNEIALWQRIVKKAGVPQQ
ncbi:Bug family tripartite tricarboxylate transporter substrate binding protein [Bordetella hinzii]|uniref:Tripartite tricarboxylate transporter family receptor n=1 Tax=Bordetella hinzii OH87 BAL007II TaxID=1331262 RepID=A0ABR4R467_9BORD|nr:tripartite tricarboxylate transporter substrate binding protein [Bordetella hinzii]KCB24916.1 tripartite tricarboxylate transporter family receptor [Bordetella hinzii OH87 BAL007II]QDJ39825.1 tripartite tricarboxylate transporter substrate binding protein [Bordetella hinzii]QDJ44345.1 tripartite tricarboxylate transporter substrate binding protein [Bordetella hinzii]QDJ53356.1 tripartite tricarboxylate transporter substrate binding protein [Bordetella hinzii]WPL80008.1 tripartite tricarboxy